MNADVYNATYYAAYEALQKLGLDRDECYRRAMAAAHAAAKNS